MNDLSLPPTQYLVMEVLAARHRLGESFWPFPQTCRKAIDALATAGLVHVIKDHDVVGQIRVGLTTKGVYDWLSDAYKPPSWPEPSTYVITSAPADPCAFPRFHLFRKARS